MTAPLSQVRLVLFDLDGTLVDSAPQLHRSVVAALAALGKGPVTLSEVSAWVGNGADMLLRRAWQGRHEVDAMPPAELPALRAAFDADYAEAATQGVSLYPGVRETLTSLQQAGKCLALVTNKPSRFVPAILDQVGLRDLFSQVVGGDCLPVRKPDPAPLLHICAQAGIPPEQSLMVGDSRSDVLAARHAGMPVVGLTYGYNHGEPIAASDPDWILDDFAKLTPLVLGSL
ncbi:phosphoglycolate phosphatase [Pseudaeromonas paramecii]|uniref:Phosphoglycolate phosphatase n=1 Tax=Pseudaeromonas paramecii TaxID=2138166 RepID=A0ABP8Q9C3_9GAMM